VTAARVPARTDRVPGGSTDERTELDRLSLSLPKGVSKRASKRSQVVDALKAAIVAGRMSTGMIYSAPALASALGTSPTPVREAMIDLEKEGLVVAVRNKGFRVLEPTAADLHNILELRLLIEVPIVSKLAQRGVREAELVQLEPIARETVRAATNADVIAHVAADLRFHSQLIDLWGNREITAAVRVLRERSRLEGLWSSSNRDAMLTSANEHLRIVSLIRERKAHEAEQLMNTHLNRVGRLWTQAVSEGSRRD
jgi:DNA-binding GntR family transcriptional regulator